MSDDRADPDFRISLERIKALEETDRKCKQAEDHGSTNIDGRGRRTPGKLAWEKSSAQRGQKSTGKPVRGMFPPVV